MSPEHGGHRYRADIDGLRALAVAAVILYHAKVPGFSGGYLGVDVFFVISGYLITQVLEASAGESPTRALAQFFLRRARRLLPALFVVLAASGAVAIALYLPSDLQNFGRSLTLAAVFLGNVGAWLNGGYFDPGDRFTPLRHLWSIGVEEQFYLVYPLLLFAVLRYRAALRGTACALLALSSLLLAFWAAERWPIQNFYLLPTRAWELLLGAYLAVNLRLRAGNDATRQIVAVLGLGGLLAVFALARVIRFPAVSNFVACGCTALLIIGNASGPTLIGSALCARPVVFTGLISYSLYLWHAPILGFFSYFNILDPSGAELCLILLSVYAVGCLSWAGIERPFRTRSLARRNPVFVATAAGVGLLLAGLGYWLVRADGLPRRWDPRLLAATMSAGEVPRIDANCANASLDAIAAGGLCSYGPRDESATKVVVWGDSHAFALLPAYQSLAIADGIRIYFATKGACWPLVGSEAASSGEFWRERCAQFNSAMVEAIHRLNPRRVILNAYWLDPGAAGEGEFLRRSAQTSEKIREGITRTLEAIRTPARSVCAVLTVPGYSYPILYALAMAQRRHLDPNTLTITRAEALQEYHTVEGQLRLAAGENELRAVDPKDVLCPATDCLIRTAEGTPLYRDANHVSIAGAHLLSGVLEQCLADLH